MDYKALENKLHKIKRALNALHQDQLKRSTADFENFKLQLTVYEELVGPEIDEAEMFYVEGQLDELALRLGVRL